MAEQTSFPLTEPHGLPIFDTGPHPDPLTRGRSFSRVEEFRHRRIDASRWAGTCHAEPTIVPPLIGDGAWS